MIHSRFRSIWISDVHLGIKSCRAEFLLGFLGSCECDRLYLVGDVVDFEKLPRSRHWPESHRRVLETILAKSMQGTEVIYIPGNHDEIFRRYVGLAIGAVQIERERVHETRDGRRLLVIHGDELDGTIRYGRLLNGIGERGYDVLLLANRWSNVLRRWLNLPYWSLANVVKQYVDNVFSYVTRFETAAAREAARRGLDGVICGHIHKPAMIEIDGILYCNDGDWVESCTALVEHGDGSLGIVHCAEETRVVAREPATLQDPGW